MIKGLQKIASYFWDIQIDYRNSDINGDLIVFLVKGKYQLCTANAIYSYETKYDNFGNIFEHYLDLKKIKGNRVLILGLGLGSVPQILDKYGKGSWDFVAVEIDPEVCELAALYGYPLISSPIQTHVLDAEVFIHTCSDKFDIICLDLFIDDEVPQHCASSEFLNGLKNLLDSQGVLIANTLAFSEKHKTQSMAYFNEKFKSTFNQACLVHTHKNYMLISDTEFLIRGYSKEVIA